jgi:hypothetical protein
MVHLPAAFLEMMNNGPAGYALVLFQTFSPLYHPHGVFLALQCG